MILEESWSPHERGTDLVLYVDFGLEFYRCFGALHYKVLRVRITAYAPETCLLDV